MTEDFGVTEEGEKELSESIHNAIMAVLESLSEDGWDRNAACVILGRTLILEGGCMIGAIMSLGQESSLGIAKSCLATYSDEAKKRLSARRN